MKMVDMPDQTPTTGPNGWQQSVRKWVEILLPVLAIGGIGGVTLNNNSTMRYNDNAEYTDVVSIEVMKLELKFEAWKRQHEKAHHWTDERLSKMEGTHSGGHDHR